MFPPEQARVEFTRSRTSYSGIPTCSYINKQHKHCQGYAPALPSYKTRAECYQQTRSLGGTRRQQRGWRGAAVLATHLVVLAVLVTALWWQRATRCSRFGGDGGKSHRHYSITWHRLGCAAPDIEKQGLTLQVRQWVHGRYLPPGKSRAPESMQACAEYVPGDCARWYVPNESSSTDPTLNFCPYIHLQLTFELTGSLFLFTTI